VYEGTSNILEKEKMNAETKGKWHEGDTDSIRVKRGEEIETVLAYSILQDWNASEAKPRDIHRIYRTSAK